jgi:hypothetical protein
MTDTPQPMTDGCRRTTRRSLAHREARFACERFSDNLDVADLGPGRPGPAPGDYCLHRGRVPFEHRLHPSIGPVADPTRDHPLGRPTAASLAEPDALHPSVDPHVTTNGGGLGHAAETSASATEAATSDRCADL